MIKLRNITKVYGEGNSSVYALREINLDIEKEEMIAIMGPSGSGKSTLLNIIGLLDDASKGNYIFMGNNVQNMSIKEKALLRNQKLGFVVQDFALVEKYTVKQNVEIPFAYRKDKLSKKEQEKRIRQTLHRFGIEEKMFELVYNLSGGQRQRVAIARAVINDADIILADEPTGALDSATAEEIINIFKELNGKGKTIIMVTHDKDIADNCNRIINIKDGQILYK
ncbi:MAG: ABC transporter ATP-binding protein [Clostridiaceae bacterium]|nr:ABC transporter ATP-binding protein [Clostridiaceae bacterium]